MSDKLVNITLRLNDKVTKPLRNAQKSFDSFVSSKLGWTESVSKSFGALSKAAGVPKFNKSIGSLAGSLSDVGKESLKLGGMILGGTTAGIAGMVALAKSTESFAGHLVDNVKRIGFNVEAYQELQYAAKKSGVSTEDFDKSMQKMTRSLGEAKAGQGALYSFLNRTNPALLKQVIAAESNEEAFNVLTGALGGLKDASKQAAFANIVFGKSGANFTNLANSGADGIKGLRDEARALGILTEDQVMNADSLGDTMDALEQVFASIKNTIGASLIPVVKSMGEEFISFYKANKGELDKFLKAFQANLPQIIESLKDAFFGLVEAIKVVVNIFNFLGQNLGYANTIMLIIAATIGKGLVMSCLAAGKAFIGLGVAIMTTPIGWIVGGIALVVGAIYMLWKHWDSVVNFLKDSWKGIGLVLMAINPIFGLIVGGLLWVWKNWDKVFSFITDKVAKLKGILPSWLGGGNKTIDINQNQTATSTVRNLQEAQSIRNESEIKVSFDNMPRGARVESKGSSNVETDISMGLMATGTL